MDAGARIIGGCCGTSYAHLAAMRAAIDAHQAGTRPSVDDVIARIGPLVSPPAAESGDDDGAGRRGRRRRG